MGSLLVSPHRGLFRWQGLLLVVSLLTFWSPPTKAQISIVSTCAPEGEDVLLRIRNKPPEIVGVVWYKGKGVDQKNITAFSIKTSSYYLSGPEHNGEEMLTDEGSLLFKNVTMKDAGIYTVVVQHPDSTKEMGFGELNVLDREEWLETTRILERLKQCKKRRLSDCVSQPSKLETEPAT